MKNQVLTLLVLLLTFNAHSQITLEHTYSESVYPVHFSGVGYKYYNFVPTALNSGTINIYNLDHSLYQSINTPNTIPQSQVPNNPIYINYLSDSLFNTNTSDFEYMISWFDTTYKTQTMIFDNAGNTLLSDSLIHNALYTPNGWKLINYTYDGGSGKVYSLPGALPCDECNNGIMSGIGTNPSNQSSYLLNGYPNPTSNTITIGYKLPEGINQGELVIYDLSGKEIKRYKVDKTFTSLNVSTNDIATGTYLYQLQTNGNAIESKKMIVVK